MFVEGSNISTWRYLIDRGVVIDGNANTKVIFSSQNLSKLHIDVPVNTTLTESTIGAFVWG